ncbi:MAG: arginine deiminase-related protein, partial [Candidatus Woesearchaeota archaeon]|nr:arginine deiminase-related protein [Candidatus Woesearchaeota archaeon]
VLQKTFPSLAVIGPFELTNPWFYHLDTAFALLNKNTVLYYPDAFSQKTQQIIPELFSNAMPVSKADTSNFALNMVCINKTIFLNTCSQELQQILESLGYTVIKLGLTEFLKSGGSIKCLTLRIA